MSLVRWDPFSDFDALFNRMLPSQPSRRPRLSSGAEFEWSPSADVSETEKAYLIRAELPAVKKEDVRVTVDNGMITIQGERKQHKEDKSEKSIRVENFYGTFTRSFMLPDNVDVESIRCEDKDGVLTVYLPKTKEATPAARQIKVE